jgi:hypothetical protein
VLLRAADIGELGEHRVLLLDRTSGDPVVKLDQPSLGAAEPSGLTHETCIHTPACAEEAMTARPAKEHAHAHATVSALGARRCAASRFIA